VTHGDLAAGQCQDRGQRLAFAEVVTTVRDLGQDLDIRTGFFAGISNRFRRDLRRLDAGTHRRVIEALEQLQDDPYQGSRLTNVGIGQ
jgi:hypothetical protein